MGCQRRFDRVGGASRALTQTAPEHPEQHVGVGDDGGHQDLLGLAEQRFLAGGLDVRDLDRGKLVGQDTEGPR